MKNIFFALFVTITSLSLHLSADQIPHLQQSVVVEERVDTITETQQVAAAPTGQTMASDCSALPADQQVFAGQLNATNKMMFCSQFSADQRISAMAMVGTMDSTGSKMSADQSVEQTATMNGMIPMQSNQQKRAGGCPVR